MASHNIKEDLDSYFQDNWTETSIQYHGQTLDISSLDDFVSLIYSPVLNEQYGMSGNCTERIEYNGVYKVFCYAKNPMKSHILADLVKVFFDGKQIGNITVNLGQDRMATDLKNGLYEVLVSFDVSELT